MPDNPTQPPQDNLDSETTTETTPTWEGEIKDFFTQQDIGCMRNNGLDLTDYDVVSVKQTAETILTRVSGTTGGGRMPLHARAWSDGKVARFREWVEKGCPKKEADLARPEAGAPETDAGAPETDAGAPETDAGAPETDAGAPETGEST